jgi:hypothetical protein
VGQLLQGLVPFQQAMQASPLTIGSIATKDNGMANIACQGNSHTHNIPLLQSFNGRWSLTLPGKPKEQPTWQHNTAQ